MAEYLDDRRAARVTPVYDHRRLAESHVRRDLGERWTTDAYSKTFNAACERANVAPWGTNRLRHTFGTEVRWAFGLEAAKSVLGHTGGGCVTDVYTFDALDEEMIRAATSAVEALG